jgi:hypothetical protein
MIGATLLERLVAVYAGWLDQDELGVQFLGPNGLLPDGRVTPVREFLEELIRAASGVDAVIELPAALKHPESTFGQLLGSSLVTHVGPPVPVEAVARHKLCMQVVPMLLVAGLRLQDEIDNGGQIRGRILEESGCENPDDFTRWGHSPANKAGLADALLQVLKSKLSQRTIRSFFMVDVASNGYRRWASQMRASKGAGTALARHIDRTSTGDVSIEVLRYSVEEEVPVRAYEWCAELREDAASETPDAIAYGMAYAFKREHGVPTGGEWDLLTAADCMADVDFLQVNAFLEQHPDAHTLIDAGDLVFVWMWERRAGVRPGAGWACLQAALADLRRRLRRIRTVVIDLKPYQFVVSDGAGMPATLHVEKLEAVDRLQAFIAGLHLEEMLQGHCRFIVNREGDDPNAALRVLGYAGLAQQATSGPDKA